MEQGICVEGLTLNYRTTVRPRSIRSAGFFSGRNPVKLVKALDQVSFQVKKGEILGIIGVNGSGKSTLLQVLAGVMEPDEGRVSTFGQKVSLLSLGLGFQPELSGADNIYLSGLLLGFSEQEIGKKYREIWNFSELGSDIYRPVKTYSSGMYARLAFSIAVTLQPEILLLDEVLSVGDLGFRQKSYAKIEAMIRDQNTTVLMVSHNLSQLQRLCDRVMWLDRGRLRQIGPAQQVIEAYRCAYTSQEPGPAVRALAIDGGVQLTWSGVSDAMDYRIYRKSPAGWEIIGDGCLERTFVDRPPDPNRSYCYGVKARINTPIGPVWSGVVPSDPVKPGK